MISYKTSFSKWMTGLGMLATISMYQYPKTPPPPEPIAISLYAWNAASAACRLSVRVDGEEKFSKQLDAGKGEAAHDFVELLPGDYRVEAVSGDLKRGADIRVAAGGPDWLVVTVWKSEIEVTLQHQPPLLD